MNKFLQRFLVIGAFFIGSATASAAEVGTIGVSVLTLNNPFFIEIADSISKEAKKHGYDVITTSADFDVAKQQNQIKDFIVKQVSAIVLCPADSKAIGPAIREANEAGIPVFTADIASLDPQAKVVSHVATDNLQGGKMAAEALVEGVKGKGKVAILDHPEVESVLLRTNGFEQRLAELNQQPETDVKVVAKLAGGGDRSKSFKVMQDIIQAHPDLDGLFAINDPSALGAYAALENAGKADEVVVVGFDGQPEGKKAIRDGKIYADPIQFPEKIGKKVVDLIAQYMKGEEVPSEVLIPTELYRQEDAKADSELK